MAKLSWQGRLTGIQPRIRLTRSFDQRSHTYLGYCLFIHGNIGSETGGLSIGIGESAQDKFQFRSGDMVSGESEPVADERKEPVQFYKTARLKVLERGQEILTSPPFLTIAPPLEVYREHGHRRLDAKTYDANCASCMWGCRMPVEMIIDHWNPGKMKYRFETFCYGPKNCRFYHPGKIRTVPGRKDMVWHEEDWVDEDETSHWDEGEGGIK
jgi:hypothetical protein